ncbi:MAG: GntR family transcriptional regulator [Bryobacteraceae bacterium]
MTNTLRFRLDPGSGVPVYRQIIDQILGGIAAGSLSGGDQLPTVRQVAVELSINPNTVVRAYRELEIRGVLATQQGIGTFITEKKIRKDEAARQRQLTQLAGEWMARAGAAGFSVEEVIERIEEFQEKRRK